MILSNNFIRRSLGERDFLIFTKPSPVIPVQNDLPSRTCKKRCCSRGLVSTILKRITGFTWRPRDTECIIQRVSVLAVFEGGSTVFTLRYLNEMRSAAKRGPTSCPAHPRCRANR